MQVTNDSYDETLRRYEWLLRHSKTGRALGLDKQDNFDSALEDASGTRTAQGNASVVRMEQASDTTQTQDQQDTSRYPKQQYSDAELYMRWRYPLRSGRDILIAEEAERHSQSMDISGRRDTAIAAPVQRENTGRDTLLAASEKYVRSRFRLGRDTLIVKAAETHTQSMDISGRRDPAIIARDNDTDERDTMLSASEKYLRTQFPIKQDVLLSGASEEYVRKIDAAVHPEPDDSKLFQENAAVPDKLLIEATEKYMRSMIVDEPDTFLAEAAHRYAQAMDISGDHDTVFIAPV